MQMSYSISEVTCCKTTFLRRTVVKASPEPWICEVVFIWFMMIVLVEDCISSGEVTGLNPRDPHNLLNAKIKCTVNCFEKKIFFFTELHWKLSPLQISFAIQTSITSSLDARLSQFDQSISISSTKLIKSWFSEPLNEAHSRFPHSATNVAMIAKLYI